MEIEIKLKDTIEDGCNDDIWHDVVYTALNAKEKISDDKLNEYFDELPLGIKMDFVQWGIGDTVTRDNAFVFLREKYSENQ